MSTLETNTISTADGSESVATTYIVNGTAKAWCDMATAGGTPTISDSLNAASLTDDAVGLYKVNYINSFAGGNYVYSLAFEPTSGNDTNNNITARYGEVLSSSLGVVTGNTSGAQSDETSVAMIMMGDLV